MTEFLFADGGVWHFGGASATVTPHGCYPHVVAVSVPPTEESARALLAATPRRRLYDPAVEREAASRIPCAGEPVLGCEW